MGGTLFGYPTNAETLGFSDLLSISFLTFPGNAGRYSQLRVPLGGEQVDSDV